MLKNELEQQYKFNIKFILTERKCIEFFIYNIEIKTEKITKKEIK